MRIKDAISALRAGKRKTREQQVTELATLWTEQAQPGETPMEYPRPQMRRAQWHCLNGFWQYAFTDTVSRPERFEGRILVPFSPECRRSRVGRRLDPGKYLWYFRSIDLDGVPEGKRLLLHFGAVDERCIVWWNGKLVGSHLGGYLSFAFDVTNEVRSGKNTIWVRVEDDTDSGNGCRGKQALRPGGMFYTSQSGIWQTVWMEWVPENHIDTVRITPLFDQQQVKLEISMTEPADMEVTVQGAWTSYLHRADKSVFIWQEQDNTSHGSVSGRCAVAAIVLDLPEMHPWTPEDPFLYDLFIRAGEDQVSSYFAMRKFSVGEDKQKHPRLMLNNEPYFFNGVLDQGYWPESLYTAPSDRAMIADIENMKRLGFNMLRKHVKIEPLRWYYHCDRIGMVVWQDMVNGGSINKLFQCYLPNLFPPLTTGVKDTGRRLLQARDKMEREQWEQSCYAAISQLYNCPCIGMWILFNESWGQFDALRITKNIKKKDPTRPVDHASGWFDQGGGDVKSIHNYFRRLKVQRDRRPCVISEYGGAVYAVKGHTYVSGSAYGYHSCRTPEAFAAMFRKREKQIRLLEKEGLSGAVYTQLSDVEGELNGIYTYDRRVCKVSS